MDGTTYNRLKRETNGESYIKKDFIGAGIKVHASEGRTSWICNADTRRMEVSRRPMRMESLFFGTVRVVLVCEI